MEVDEILVIIILSMIFVGFVYAFLKYDLTPLIRLAYIKWVKTTGIILAGLIITYLLLNLEDIQPNSWVLIALYTGLVGITLVYAVGAHRQANANVKMAEEMREQRVLMSKPIVTPRAVHKSMSELRTFGSMDYFLRFEIYNEGNGPAIELEILILDENKSLLESTRETIFRANEPPIKYIPSEFDSLKESITHYLLCQYQSIYSKDIWYQTWFPFETVKSSKIGKYYVKPRELLFTEIQEKQTF